MAVNTFDNLPQVLRKRKNEMVGLVNTIARRAAVAAGTHLVRSTPVKRGIARSNWVATVDTPFDGVIPAYHPYPSLDNGPAPIEMFGETQNQSSAIRQHAVAVQEFNALRNRSIRIQNNVGHISALNNGHSRQNPVPGWFEMSTPVAIAAIRGQWRLAL